MELEDVIIPYEVEQKLIWKHNIQAYEVDEIFKNRPRIRFAQKGKIQGENLYVASGQSDEGRYLHVFFIHKKNLDALVISAREMTAKEKRYYGKKS
jgi:uncharacterized DUF497 family protein